MPLYEFSDDFTVGRELHDNLNSNQAFHTVSLMLAGELTATGMRIAPVSIYEISCLVISDHMTTNQVGITIPDIE